MPKFRKDKYFNIRCKETYLSLLITDLEERMKREGKKLADDLVEYTASKGMQDICIRNFMANVQYGITEMLYVKELAAKDGIAVENDRPETLIQMYEGNWNGITLFQWLLPNDFNYKKKRYLTRAELDKRNGLIKKSADRWFEKNKDLLGIKNTVINPQ